MWLYTDLKSIRYIFICNFPHCSYPFFSVNFIGILFGTKVTTLVSRGLGFKLLRVWGSSWQCSTEYVNILIWPISKGNNNNKTERCQSQTGMCLAILSGPGRTPAHFSPPAVHVLNNKIEKHCCWRGACRFKKINYYPVCNTLH